MSTSPKSISLKCQSCGAGLSITAEMERFACGYCGTEQIVQRNGGTVFLRILHEEISQVRVGTDKTAAELAIKRITGELAEIERQLKVAQEQFDSAHPAVFVLVGLFFTGVYWFVKSRGWTSDAINVAFFVTLGILVLATFGATLDRPKAKERLEALQKQRDTFNEQIRKARLIVEGD